VAKAIQWRRLLHRLIRERAAILGLAMTFLLGLVANGAIQAGNFELTLRGVSSSAIGYATAAQAFGIIAAAPLLALISTNYRRANVVIIAGAVTAFSFLAVFISDNWLLGLLTRFSLGAGVGLAMAFMEYIVISQVRRDVRPVLATLFGVTLAAGHASGTLLAGQTGAPFMVIALAAAVMVGALILSPWGRLKADRERVPLRALPGIVSLSPAVFAAAALFGFLDNGFLSMLPDIFHHAGFDKEEMIFTSFMAFAGICAFQIPAGIMCLKFEPFALLRGTVLALIVLLMAMAMTLDGDTFRIATVFVSGGLIDLIYTVGLISMANAVRRDRLVSANACFVSCCGIGEVAGPSVTGPALDYVGVGGAIGIVLALLALYWIFSASYQTANPAAEARPTGYAERRAAIAS